MNRLRQMPDKLGAHSAPSKTPARIRTAVTILMALLAVTLCWGLFSPKDVYAYLSTSTNSKVNAMEQGSVDVTLQEKSSGTDIDPGSVTFGEHSKQVSVLNGDNSVAYVRVRIGLPTRVAGESGSTTTYYPTDLTNASPAIDDAGFAEPDSNNTVTVDNYVYHFSSNWSDDWFYRDGYFYYKHPLPTETSTSTLLEGITETSSNGATVDVPVTVDAIQANPTSFVEDAWGVTVTDGELS